MEFAEFDALWQCFKNWAQALEALNKVSLTVAGPSKPFEKFTNKSEVVKQTKKQVKKVAEIK